MNHLTAIFEHNALLLVGVALAFAAAMIISVAIERIAGAAHEAWLRRLTAHYTPLVRLALAGDPGARAVLPAAPLVASPHDRADDPDTAHQGSRPGADRRRARARRCAVARALRGTAAR